MKTIATSEASARPSLGRPKDQPEDDPKNRLLIHYQRNGTVLRMRLKESMSQALAQAVGSFANVSGHHFSQTILVRRALDIYLREVAKMNHETLQSEASLLKHQFR